jgi:hypothetical protein
MSVGGIEITRCDTRTRCAAQQLAEVGLQVKECGVQRCGVQRCGLEWQGKLDDVEGTSSAFALTFAPQAMRCLMSISSTVLPLAISRRTVKPPWSEKPWEGGGGCRWFVSPELWGCAQGTRTFQGKREIMAKDREE